MISILIIFLGTLYSFSGLTCSMAFFRHITKLLSPENSLQQLNPTLSCIAIAIFWPIWMVKEIWHEDPDSNEVSQEVSNTTPETTENIRVNC